MAAALGYADLDMDRADSMLSQTGELFVSPPEKHARACTAYIETIRAAQSWSTNRTPFVKRLWPLAKGLWITLRILFTYSRLFELGRVVFLNTASQSWSQGADGNFLFRFAR
jgi:hypothetical protein